MDAPDPVVRSAMAKAMNPQGLPPMTQKELNRLLGRQYLEAQDRQTQANNASLQTMRMRQEIASTLPGAKAEAAADRLLKAKFGVMEPGDIQIATKDGYRVINAGSAYKPGIEGIADAMLKDRFGAMLPGEVEVATQRGTTMLLPDQPQGTETPAPQAVQDLSGFSGNTAIERLLGRNLSLMQGAGTAQPMGAPTPSNVFSYTPAAMAQQLGQRRFEADYAADQRKQMIETVSAMYGQGQDINQLNLPPDILSEAVVRGEKIRNEISRKYPASKSIIRDGVVYTQRYNPETGEELGDLIPIRSTQNLPGSARPQSKGQLVPAIDKTTGQPIPNLYLDTDTGQLRSTAPLSERASLLSDTGFGGFNQTQTGKPTTTGVRTYEQLVREMQGAAK